MPSLFPSHFYFSIFVFLPLKKILISLHIQCGVRIYNPETKSGMLYQLS